MKMGSGWYRAVNSLFSVEVEAIFIAEDFIDGMRRPVSDGMRYAPKEQGAQGAKERRPAYEKESHCGNEWKANFQGEEPHDRDGPGRSIYLLVCSGRSGGSDSGTKASDDETRDQARVRRNAAQPSGSADRGPFSLGQPAVDPTGT